MTKKNHNKQGGKKITLKAGDKIHMYETRAKNRKSTDPQFHLKVLRATPDSDN